MTDDEVRTVANEVLAGILGPSGFDHAEVRSAPDHDGDLSYFVTAHFKPGSGITAGDLSMRAHTALWTRLLARNDKQFPYLDFRYPDDEVLTDDEEVQNV